jgi:uncharacterized cupin superfamily protein
MQLLKAPERIPSTGLEDWGKVEAPLGEPVAQLRGREVVAGPDGAIGAGVWECTPGKWRRQVKQAEFCHFVAGHCFFQSDGGDRLEIRAGDAVFFPENTTGTWEVVETVRKTYVTFKPAAGA